jgi:hypothetical protein
MNMRRIWSGAGEIEGQALWFLPIFPAPDGVAVPKSPTIPDA